MKFTVLLSLLLISLGGTTYRGAMPAEDICLTTEERKLYDLMMEYRKSKGLEAIPLSAQLTQVAHVHARDLAEHYTFDPKRNKCNPHSWSENGKWTSCCYTADHKQAPCVWRKPQEITGYPAYGYEIVYYSSNGANAKEGLDGWKISPGHNTMIINSETWSKLKWNAIGIGIYKKYGLVWFGEAADASVPSECR